MSARIGRMQYRRTALALPLALAAVAAYAVACGDEAASPDAADASAGVPGTGDEVDPGTDPDPGPTKDGSVVDKDAECNDPPAPTVDGGGPCGTYAFGKPAAEYVKADEDAGAYAGGELRPGIYDTTLAERASGAKGSWRETFAIDADGNFTRIRELDNGSGPAEVTYRAGKATFGGNDITLTYSCAMRGAEVVDAGRDILPYDGMRSGCDAPVYRYGVFGVRATLTRR